MDLHFQPGCTLRTLIAQSLMSYQVALSCPSSMAELNNCHLSLGTDFVSYFLQSVSGPRLSHLLSRHGMSMDVSCKAPSLGTGLQRPDHFGSWPLQAYPSAVSTKLGSL